MLALGVGCNRTQAKQFTDAIAAVLARYENRQLTSAEVVASAIRVFLAAYGPQITK